MLDFANDLPFGKYVRLSYDASDETVEGLFCRSSETFTTLFQVVDWHLDGLLIVPNGKVRNIYYDDITQAREVIVEWKGVSVTDKYDWLSLNSWNDLLKSIMARHIPLYVSDGDDAEVGLVLSVDGDCFALKGIDGFGEYMNEIIYYQFSDVESISIGDEYSTVISSFADRN